MPTRIDLPGGATADLLGPDELTHGRRRPLLAEVEQRDMEKITDLMDLAEVAIKVYVTSWTVTGPDGAVLPTPYERADVLDELPVPVFDALMQAVLPLLRSVTAVDVPEPEDGEEDPTKPSASTSGTPPTEG